MELFAKLKRIMSIKQEFEEFPGNPPLKKEIQEIDIEDIKIMTMKNDAATATSKSFNETASQRDRKATSLPPERSLFQTLLANLPDNVFFKDANSRFIMANKACTNKVFSLSDPEKCIGRTDFDFFPQEYALQSYESEQRIMSSGKPEIGEEKKITWPDGRIAWVLESKFPLLDEKGSTIGIWGISREITAYKQAEEELKASEEMLRQAQKMEAFGQLAGGIAHDFNNMLSVILGSAQLVEMSLQSVDSEIKKNIAMVIDSSKQAADLTQKLLTFARKGNYKIVVLDIHEVIHSVVGLLQHTIDKRIRIVERLNARQSTAMGDFMQLQNALLNLALNARDAMPDGGTLTFSTEMIGPDEHQSIAERDTNKIGHLESYLQVSVNDTGTGMDEKTKMHVFEPFFTTKEPGKGTGLGLASVYGTIKSHKGLIDFETEEKKGTTFKLYLPLIITTQERHDDDSESAQKGSGKILIIDDEENIRLIVAKMLETLGYSVTVEKDGLEAIEYYRNHCDDIIVIIVDLIMPRISGNDCIKKIKEINPRACILVSSGYSLVSDTQQIISRGIAGFIQKPFDINDLSRALSDALAKR
jgi:two-component system, cell cycle sensor histidine kinase and response regulator CckA